MLAKILGAVGVGALVVIGGMFIFKNNVAHEQSASAEKLAQVVLPDGRLPAATPVPPRTLRTLCTNPKACNYTEPPIQKTGGKTWQEGNCLMAYYSLSQKDVNRLQKEWQEESDRRAKVTPRGVPGALAPPPPPQQDAEPRNPPMPNNDCTIGGPCDKEPLYIKSYTLTPEGKELNKKISFLGFYESQMVFNLTSKGYNACKSKAALDEQEKKKNFQS